MTKINYFIGFALLLISVLSCSIEKRLYNKGYHIEWFNNSISKQTIETNSNFNDTKLSINNREDLESDEFNDTVYSTEIVLQKERDSLKSVNEDEILEIAEKSNITPASIECDSIVLRNGKVITGKVIEINDNTIKYTNCNSSRDVLREVKTNDVTYIKYFDESKEEFTKEMDVNEEIIASTFIAGAAILIASFASGIGLLAGFLAFLLSMISIYETKSSVVSYLSLLAAVASIVIVVLLFI